MGNKNRQFKEIEGMKKTLEEHEDKKEEAVQKGNWALESKYNKEIPQIEKTIEQKIKVMGPSHYERLKEKQKMKRMFGSLRPRGWFRNRAKHSIAARKGWIRRRR